MAEIETGTAIVPSPTGTILQVKDFNAAGGSDVYSIAVPDDPIWKSIMIRAAFLKKGVMATLSFGQIVCAIQYADSMGLDVLAKDVYVVNGNLAVSAEGKIKFADQSGRVEWRRIKVTKSGEKTVKYTEKGIERTCQVPNLHAVVTIKLKADPEPQEFEWDLDDFFNASNAAWRTDTKSMFSKRAIGKTLGIMVPTGVDGEEVPVTDIPGLAKAVDDMKKLATPRIGASIPPADGWKDDDADADFVATIK